jgi:uncharacterized protein with HEPN domain
LRAAAPRLADYLGHILEAMARIERYTRGMDEAAFSQSPLVQDAVIRNFEIIGEASNNIARRYPGFTAAHPELPLAVAYEMRNAVAHGYFRVDLGIVWKTIRDDLPAMKPRIEAAISEATSGRQEPKMGA